MAEEETKKPGKLVMNCSIEAQLAETLLRGVAEEEDVTDDQLVKAMGRKMEDGGRGRVQTALRRVAKDGIHFERIRKVGYRRLPPGQTIRKVRANTRRQHNMTRRNVQILMTTPFDRLTADERTTYSASMSAQSLIYAVTAANALPKIERCIPESTAPAKLALAETVEALSKKKET